MAQFPTAANTAIAYARERIKTKPDQAWNHAIFGDLFGQLGRNDDALAAYQEAVRLDPPAIALRKKLADKLIESKRVDDAVAVYREGIRLDPNDTQCRFNLALALGNSGKFDEVIAVCREMVRVTPDFAEGHFVLGGYLLEHGEYVEALSELRRSHELGSKRSDWRYPSEEWVRKAERQNALAAQLTGLLTGGLKPKDTAEALELARHCQTRHLYGIAVYLWQRAFADEPKQADDLKSGNRYNAACAAALAGSGKGKEFPPPAESVKAALLTQSRVWLNADLVIRAKHLSASDDAARKEARDALSHWKADPDLAGVRDADNIVKLSEPERKEWQALWGKVDKLLGTKK